MGNHIAVEKTLPPSLHGDAVDRDGSGTCALAPKQDLHAWFLDSVGRESRGLPVLTGSPQTSGKQVKRARAQAGSNGQASQLPGSQPHGPGGAF